jgi:uncharacterized membrane protein YjfL (UPF0719 family)
MQFDFVSRAYATSAKDFSKIPEGTTYTGSLDNILTIIIGIASVLAVLALIIGAFQYLAAAGDPAKAESAKKTITWAITGIVLMMLFYVILTFVLPNVIPQ